MKRPNYDFTQEELLEVSRNIYSDESSDFEDCGIDEIMIYDVVYHDRTLNGYEYAKELESKGAFSINSIIVDALDGISIVLYNLNKNHIKQWVKDNNIKPIHKVGDLVEYEDYRKGKIREVIKDINLEEGIYHVRISDKESRLIPFENVIKG